MPTIPVIQDSAQLDTGTGRQNVRADADAFGALEARGAQAVAQGLGTVAQAASDIDDEFNEANARELDNELSRRIRERLYNTEDGYLSTQRGRNALDSRGQFEAEVDTMAAELARTARNPRAAALFTDVAQRRVGAALGEIATHAARENINYQNTVSEAAIQEAMDNAVAAYADPVAVEENIRTALGEVRRIADRNGWDEEIIAARERQLRSDMTARVIVSLAATDPEAAEEMYQQARPTLSAQEAGELLTTLRAIQAQARERVTGAVWQAYANGQDPTQTGEWEEFVSNPLFGREHETFNEYRRQRALSAAANALSTRQSELAGDMLEAQGALNPRALMLITDYATGRLSVGMRMPRQRAPDMTAQEFEAETGVSPAEARRMFQMLNPDDLLRVLNRRNGQTDNSAIDRAYDDIRRVAEPMALSMGLPVTGTGAGDAETRGAFQAYLYTEARAHVEATGQRPDDDTIDAIVRRALRRVNRTGEPHEGGGRFAFERVPYNQIPREVREAIEADWRLRVGTDPARADVERRYAEYLRARQ